MKIHTLIAGTALIVLLFAELYIDFSVDLLDTTIVILCTIAIYLFAVLHGIRNLLKKQWHHAALCVILFLAVFSGSCAGICAGIRIRGFQLGRAQSHVESLARDIHKYREVNGVWPESLDSLPGYSGNHTVDIGLLRKRPLAYDIIDDGTNFHMRFPYAFWLTARYDGITGEWIIDD